MSNWKSTEEELFPTLLNIYWPTVPILKSQFGVVGLVRQFTETVSFVADGEGEIFKTNELKRFKTKVASLFPPLIVIISPILYPVPKFKILKEDKKPEKLDEIFPIENYNLYLCNKSLMFLLGTEIDYIEDIMGSRFDFKNNNISNKCGCGTSFNFKDI